MKAQKRNLSQEFETLLNGRSILDLTGEESALAVNMLTDIVKSKPLKSLTKTELQSLVEELSEIIALNMFKGDLPENWKQETLDNIKNCNERVWEFSLTSILDFHLHNVDMWDALDTEDSEKLAKTILKYLEGKDYYDYFIGYIEDYLDDEE
ncbi:MAG: hypothetical protein RXO36_07235 [Candidatus Nanopusillus acidilobi]|jgi:replication fork clamp-binding protein CrfC